MSDLGTTPLSGLKTPADLTSASGVKSAVKNANTSADVYNAKQAADEIRGNLTNELSKIDFSESIDSKLAGSIGVEGSSKTLADVLDSVGVKLDTSALGKIDISSDDTSKIITSISQKAEAVESFAGTLKGSITKITTKSGEVKGTLQATTLTIDNLEGQIKVAKANPNADPSAIASLEAKLQEATDKKAQLEIQLKEYDAAKKAVEGMGEEAQTMQNELQEIKGKFEDLQEVENTADEKQKKLEQKEQKELTKLEKEAYDLKNKMDAEKDESKKAKLKEKYDKACAEFNQIAANTTLQGFAGRAIGEHATDSRTVYEQIDDSRQKQQEILQASMDALTQQLREETENSWSDSTKSLVSAMRSAQENQAAAEAELQKNIAAGNTPGYFKQGEIGFNNETGLPITYSGSTDSKGVFRGQIGEQTYTSQKEFEEALLQYQR